MSTDTSLAWLLDFEEFAPAMIRIRNKARALVPFQLSATQKYGRNKARRRNIWLKARQVGISTMLQGEIYHAACTQNGFRAATIAHQPKATEGLNDKLKTMLRNHPAPAPRTSYNSRKETTFPALDSSVYIGTAGSKSFGRGDTLHRVHLSEYAFYNNDPAQLLVGISQSMPDEGRIDIESTANGFNDFHRIWTEAEAGTNGFTPIFLPWFMERSYQRSPGIPRAEWTDDEKLAASRAAKFGTQLSPEQIAFRREKQKELKDDGEQDKFLQEYAEDPVTCFLLSGRPRFNIEKLQAQWVNCQPPTRTAMRYGLTIRFYEHPRPGEFYTIAADTAQGLTSSDYNAAEVMNWRTGATACIVHGRSEIFDYARLLQEIGKGYNMALIAAERKESGIALVAKLNELSYPNMYRHVSDAGNVAEADGVDTNSSTRPVMIDDLARVISTDAAALRDAGAVAELMRFVVKGSKAQAENGANDDLTMTLAINRFIRSRVAPPATTPTNAPDKFKQAHKQR